MADGEPMLHLFLDCESMTDNDYITSGMEVHQATKPAPVDVNCDACLRRTATRRTR